MDDNLDWKAHIGSIYTNIIKYTGIFYKLRGKIPANIMKNIYFATVHSKLLYGIELYANTYISYLDNLMTLNNKILRIVQNKPYMSPRVSLYKDYFTLPIDLLFKLKITQFVHQAYYNCHTLPDVFHSYFSTNSMLHAHDTRAKNLIHRHQVNNSFGAKSLQFLGAKYWNTIPPTHRLIQDQQRFKNAVKEFLYCNL